MPLTRLQHRNRPLHVAIAIASGLLLPASAAATQGPDDPVQPIMGWFFGVGAFSPLLFVVVVAAFVSRNRARSGEPAGAGADAARRKYFMVAGAAAGVGVGTVLSCPLVFVPWWLAVEQDALVGVSGATVCFASAAAPAVAGVLCALLGGAMGLRRGASRS